jgi:hypothetical protein
MSRRPEAVLASARPPRENCPRVPRAVPIALALAAVASLPSPVGAHTPGLSRADLRVLPQRIAVDLAFARPEIAGLVPGADADRSGQLDEIELLSIEGRLSAAVLDGLALAAGDVACAGAIDRIAFVEEDGLSIAASFTCPGPPPAALTVRIPLLARLAPGHRVVGRLVFADMSSETDPPALDFVAHRRRSALTFTRPTAPASAPALAPAPAPAPARWPWAAAFVGAALVLAWGFLRRRRRA